MMPRCQYALAEVELDGFGKAASSVDWAEALEYLGALVGPCALQCLPPDEDDEDARPRTEAS